MPILVTEGDKFILFRNREFELSLSIPRKTETPMKILFLSNFYPPASLGGYDQLCQEVGDALRNCGHDVQVLTSDYRSGALLEPDPKWVHRKLHLEMDLVSSRNAFEFFTKRKRREAESLKALRQTLKQISPDIVVIWGMWNLHRSVCALVEELMPDRTIYYVCDYWPTLPNQLENYWNAPPRSLMIGLPKLILKPFALRLLAGEARPVLKLEHVVCCSEYVCKTLKQAGYSLPHAGVLRNGINAEPFLRASKLAEPWSPNTSVRLLYFGRLNHDKGAHTAIQAIGLLKKRGLADHIQLTILGSGDSEYESGLRQMVFDLGVGDRVEFVASVPRDEIPNWLARSDVYLFTSIWPEPMARSVMEAMAAGLLVIGTEVGGQVEMLAHGENSLTFKPEDTQGLADQISRVLHDPQLRLKLAREGQSMVLERFTFERTVSEMEELLQNRVRNNVPGWER
jgi:glycosyltransferase involved in cell wall biosynthesis